MLYVGQLIHPSWEPTQEGEQGGLPQSSWGYQGGRSPLPRMLVGQCGPKPGQQDCHPLPHLEAASI